MSKSNKISHLIFLYIRNLLGIEWKRMQPKIVHRNYVFLKVCSLYLSHGLFIYIELLVLYMLINCSLLFKKINKYFQQSKK